MRRCQPECVLIRVWIALLILICLPTRAVDEQAKDPISTDEIEKELQDLIQKDRAALHLPELASSEVLTRIAREHSDKMAREKTLSHSFRAWPKPERKMARAGCCFTVMAENIACSETPVASLIHEALSLSPGHRANIIDPQMHQVGIGVVSGDHRFYVTEEFAAIITPLAPEDAKAMVEQSLIDRHRQVYGHVLRHARNMETAAWAISWKNLFHIPQRIRLTSGGTFRAVNLVYNDLERILNELAPELAAIRYRAIAVGVTWGRNRSYPGGAYSVTVLFFK